MIECSEGWKLVGADVDSQEQWIAALLGDSAVGQHRAGVTPFSNMLLAGSKADHSDLHSVVAKEVGISRDKAKVKCSELKLESDLNKNIYIAKISACSLMSAISLDFTFIH
ncbi:unnamed protein product [Anisakis simplex]|uniref:DNA-directed DNA polymerase n=1 Tax=Anisakis simplex TaxID=6269 RepID=A0A0M3JIL0_ANISI|nr:unnamed protein product [Anisakis simplex]